jgi:glycosyltransferase involved in cell wall biosynthesis
MIKHISFKTLFVLFVSFVRFNLKNEERNIIRLIESLKQQKYPNNKFEVIIVDDNSTDETFRTAEEYIAGLNNFSVIRALDKAYKGKRGALQTGIDKAKYDHIVITDADCEPRDKFLQSFSEKFSEGFDFIFGVAPYRQKKSFANKIASFDNLWVHILTFAFANIGLPYSASARSFGFNKPVFSKMGGYKFTTDTLSGDDDLLLREAVKNELSVGTLIKKEAFVYTNSENSVGGFIKQKSRHTSSSNYYSLKIKFILGVWHLLNILMLSAIFVVPAFPALILLVTAKLLLNTITAYNLMKIFGYRFKVPELIYLQITYEIFIVVNFVNGKFSKSKW